MLIKRMMLVAILATVANSAFGVDFAYVNQAAEEYGSGFIISPITEDALNRILEECKKVTDWNDVNQLPLSSVLRAQLSSDTTSAQIGNSDAFRRLFPVNGAAIAEEFKKLVAADSTHASRNAAINRIQELRAVPVSTPVVVDVPVAMSVPLANLRQRIASSRWDRSGDIDGQYSSAGNYEINRLSDTDFVNWKSAVTDGCSPLILAIILKDAAAIEALISAGANVNEVACNLRPLQAAKQFAPETSIPTILVSAGATD